MAAGDVAVAVTRPLANKCARFDGVDDEIELSSSVNPSFIMDGYVTISGWLYRLDNNGEHAIISFGFSFAADAGCVISLENSGDATNPDKLRFVLGGNIYTGIGSAFPYNEWAHFLIIFNNSRGTLDYYINGVLSEAKSSLDPMIQVSTGTNSSEIGTQQGSRRFLGGMYDLRVYKKALSSTEITKVAAGQLVTDGLIHRWKLDTDYTDSVGSADGTNSGTRLTAIDDQIPAAITHVSGAELLSTPLADGRVLTTYTEIA